MHTQKQQKFHHIFLNGLFTSLSTGLLAVGITQTSLHPESAWPVAIVFPALFLIAWTACVLGEALTT